MKETTSILTMIFLTIFFACGQHNKQDGKNSNKSMQLTEDNKQLSKEEKQRIIADENRIDSLRLDIASKNALSVAHEYFKEENITKKYDFQPDDSSFVINIEFVIGRLFCDNQKVLLLRRQIPWATYLSIYQIIDNEAVLKIEREQGGMTYIRDTIFDVNGDGHKDFLVHWYPSSGCCRRDIYNVYLYQPNNGAFTKDYEFINPTFSASEKIIRGVEYGHSGEVGLYKYNWNGLQIDTIEFIYPDVLAKGQFIKTKKKEYRPSEKDGVVLKVVPIEYHNIESYDWFINF